MYHHDPAVALEELQEDATLPSPVQIRDMILRSNLAPSHAIELNRRFQEYMESFADAQAVAQAILDKLAHEKPKA